MSRRVINGLKDGLFVLISVTLVTLLLNYSGWDFGRNKIWNALGNLNLVHVFNNNELNGLLCLIKRKSHVEPKKSKLCFNFIHNINWGMGI
ncbi:hypothetical protein CW743_11015 [Staphylococcus shinii]|uniref:hypothetical protein n=1 Tax=Staphylococcus shinii TaxID=2912228 RepID=UPI000C323452|nr:hypothetical protein [Staphylococcus shinii]PKI11982.1 hypothetical protein CW743_11015 [Staphylococcus shinii]